MTLRELIIQLKELAKEHGDQLEVKLYSSSVAMSAMIGTVKEHHDIDVQIDVSLVTGNYQVLFDMKQYHKELMH
jgi:hypothetical protein